MNKEKPELEERRTALVRAINDYMVSLTDLENEFDTEIPSRAIGERVMSRLKAIDQIAYVRFASVYKQFRDIDELAKEIDGLQKQP